MCLLYRHQIGEAVCCVKALFPSEGKGHDDDDDDDDDVCCVIFGITLYPFLTKRSKTACIERGSQLTKGVDRH